MAEEPKAKLRLEIAHVLFIDIVGYSKLLIDEQSEALAKLNRLVRNTESARDAATADRLIFLPTGDGMALVFTGSIENPVECALQLSQALGPNPNLPVRMGIHSGPVNHVADVNERANIAGAGINMAQRVMDCGDGGHILLSKRVADDLEHYRRWRPLLHDLGECEVKHGVRLSLVNFHGEGIGNPALPTKLKGKRIVGLVRSRYFGPGLAALLLIAAVVVTAAFLFLQTRPPDFPMAMVYPGKSVAIEPFKSLLGDQHDDALEIGMADTLINKLSTSREIIVPSLSSVRKYEDQKRDPVAIGRELHVNAVLEGNLQRAGDRIRVTARLIKVADGAALWAEQFDEKFTDVFAVEDAIAQKVATALALKLTEDEQQQLTKRYTANAEAYQLYLNGRLQWNKYTEEGFRKAIEFYNQALQKDSNYALAYAGLADAYIQLGDLSFAPPKENYPQAQAYAAKALALDDKLAQAHVAMGTYHLFYAWNWNEAEKELKRGIELNPNYADARHFYDHYLESQGRLNEAIAEIKHAAQLDPLSLIINNEFGWAYYHARRYDAALEQFQKTLAMDPRFFLTVQCVAQVYELENKPRAAIEVLEKALKPSENWSWLVAELGCAYAAAGNGSAARQITEQLKQRSATEYIDPYQIAMIYLHLGDRDLAFEWLDKAFAERSTNLVWCKVEPKFDALRSDPRFGELLRRMNLD